MSEHRYLDQVPSVIPPGKVLVHTHARVTRRLGLPGFRIWLASREELRMFEVCDCGWAPELGAHFRVRRQNRTHADR